MSKKIIFLLVAVFIIIISLITYIILSTDSDNSKNSYDYSKEKESVSQVQRGVLDRRSALNVGDDEEIEQEFLDTEVDENILTNSGIAKSKKEISKGKFEKTDFDLDGDDQSGEDGRSVGYDTQPVYPSGYGDTAANVDFSKARAKAKQEIADDRKSVSSNGASGGGGSGGGGSGSNVNPVTVIGGGIGGISAGRGSDYNFNKNLNLGDTSSDSSRSKNYHGNIESSSLTPDISSSSANSSFDVSLSSNFTSNSSSFEIDSSSNDSSFRINSSSVDSSLKSSSFSFESSDDSSSSKSSSSSSKKSSSSSSFVASSVGSSSSATTAKKGFVIPQPILPAGNNPDNVYEWFYNYRLDEKNFSPKSDIFVERFNNKTTVRFESGCTWDNKGCVAKAWVHKGYTSVAIGFRTDVPTIAVVDYGESVNDLNQTSEQYEDSWYYNHLVYLKGLKENTTYYYRIRVMDENKNVTQSNIDNFKTRTITNDVTRVPDDLTDKTLPYKLLKKGKYVLTQDITSRTIGILLGNTGDIEIDLDGHTIIYDNGKPDVIATSWDGYAYNNEATAGIRAQMWNAKNFKIFNGTIKQGKNGGTGIIGVGFNPIFLSHSGSDSTIAGVTADWYGDSIHGMAVNTSNVYHNVLYDRGHVIDNRHQQIKAIVGPSTENNNEIAYNSLRRFRQGGINGGKFIHHNELYTDSFTTNSFSIANPADSKVTYNKVFGLGYLPIGVGNGGANSYVANNLIYLHCYAPTRRFNEYDRDSTVAGIRYTNYGSNPASNQVYEGNTIILKGKNGCTQARGLWISNSMADDNNIIRNNIVKVEAMPGNLVKPCTTPPNCFYNSNVNAAFTAVTLSGGDEGATDGGLLISPSEAAASEVVPSPVIFEDNHFLGNVNLITLGEGYGIGGSMWFYRTKLEKINHDDSNFTPVRLGFWCWNTFNNRMIDTDYANYGISEANMTPYFMGGTGNMVIHYGKSKELTIRNKLGHALADSDVTITLSDGFSQTYKTDASGKVKVDVLTVKHNKTGSCIDGKCTMSCHGGNCTTAPYFCIPEKTVYTKYTIRSGNLSKVVDLNSVSDITLE